MTLIVYHILGAASVRQINGKRKDIDALMDAINAAM